MTILTGCQAVVKDLKKVHLTVSVSKKRNSRRKKCLDRLLLTLETWNAYSGEKIKGSVWVLS